MTEEDLLASVGRVAARLAGETWGGKWKPVLDPKERKEQSRDRLQASFGKVMA